MAAFDANEALTPFRGGTGAHASAGYGAILFDRSRLRQADPEWFDPNHWGSHASAVSSGGRGAAWFVDGPFGPAVLRHYLRGGLVARFGGEEFVAVLPGTDAQDALQVAEAVRLRIQQTPVATSGHGIRLSASIGVHTVPGGHQATPEDVIRIADEALYRAKDDGRNCVRHSVSAA